MPRIPIDITGAQKQNRSLLAANQITKNFFPEIVRDDNGKQAFRILMRTPGLAFLVNILGQPIRRLYQTSNSSKYWAVIGNGFYEILNNNAYTLIGNLQTNQGFCRMADNGTDIVIVDGTNDGYVYHIATGSPAGWTASLHGANINFVGGDDIVFTGGYFIVIQPGTNILQQCFAPYGTAPISGWDGSSVFSTFLSDAGPLIALGVLNDQIWAFGDYSTVIFYNAGNAVGFSFSLLPGAPIRMGIAAKNTLRFIDNSLAWVAKIKDGDRIVVRTQGYIPTRISTHELETAISKYSIVNDADAWTYLIEGHNFYIVTFPTGNETYAYDVATSEWASRSSYGVGMHIAFDHVFLNGKHIVGDRTTGNIYQLSMDVITDNGNPIISTRRCQHIKKNRDPIEIPGLILDVETGVGLSQNTQGFNPQIGFRYSKDGGKNWSNDMYASLGKTGETRTEVRFPRLGQAFDWVLEFFISDPVPCNIIGAYIEQ